jgi:hypothetical protein
MGGYGSRCGAVEGLSQGLVCTSSLVSDVYWCTELCGYGNVQPARLRHGGSSCSAVGWELQGTPPFTRCYSAKHLYCVHSAPLGGKSRPHPYLRAGLSVPQSQVLSMARIRLSGQKLAVKLGRHHGVAWFVCGCKRYAALGMHDLPGMDEAYLLCLCPATAVVRREHQLAQLPYTSFTCSTKRGSGLTPTRGAFAMFTRLRCLCTSTDPNVFPTAINGAFGSG